MNAARDAIEDASFISHAIAELQALADTFRQPLPAAHPVVTLRVAFVAGSASPWRLIETVDSSAHHRAAHRRRILCFDSLEAIRRSVDERLAWQRADEVFIANNMSTPGGFPGVTADWVPSKDFDLVFGPSRDAIRDRICATSPTRTMTLS